MSHTQIWNPFHLRRGEPLLHCLHLSVIISIPLPPHHHRYYLESWSPHDWQYCKTIWYWSWLFQYNVYNCWSNHVWVVLRCGGLRPSLAAICASYLHGYNAYLSYEICMIVSLSPTSIKDLSGTQDPDDRISSKVRLVENVFFKWNPATLGEHSS
jgi:hypothetical protein